MGCAFSLVTAAQHSSLLKESTGLEISNESGLQDSALPPPLKRNVRSSATSPFSLVYYTIPLTLHAPDSDLRVLTVWLSCCLSFQLLMLGVPGPQLYLRTRIRLEKVWPAPACSATTMLPCKVGLHITSHSAHALQFAHTYPPVYQEVGGHGGSEAASRTSQSSRPTCWSRSLERNASQGWRCGCFQ